MCGPNDWSLSALPPTSRPIGAMRLKMTDAHTRARRPDAADAPRRGRAPKARVHPSRYPHPYRHLRGGRGAGHLPARSHPHRRTCSSDAAGWNGSRPPDEVLGSSSSWLALVGLLWGRFRASVGLRQSWVVYDAKQHSATALRAVPYGRKAVARIGLMSRLVWSCGLASEDWTNGVSGEGRRQSRLMRHPFWEGNRVENDPSQRQRNHPSMKMSV